MEVTKALMEFKYESVSNEQLAKFIGFSDKELDMLKIFWEPCFNKNWFYLYPKFITQELGYKSAMDFYKDVLRKKYIEDIDYKKINKNDELVKNFYQGNFLDRKKPGNRASYYKITGKTLKLVLMRARTSIAMTTHEYYIKVEEAAIFMKDYIQALQSYNMNLQLELHAKQIKETEQLLIQSQEQIEEKERVHAEAIEEEQKKNMILTNFVENARAKEKNNVFYIVTTAQYAANNRFKFGGCDKRSLLQSNLNNYNRGKASEDKYYYVYIKSCYDYKLVEHLIKSTLPIFFKDNKNARNELVHCHYDIFREIVDMAVNNMDEFTDKINNLIKRMIQLTLYDKPADPNPIELGKKIILTITENGEEKTKIFDWDTLTDEEIYSGIKSCLELYAKEKGQEWIYDKDKDDKELSVVWKDFKRYLIDKFNIPKYRFKCKKWRKKIEYLDSDAPNLSIQWIQSRLKKK